MITNDERIEIKEKSGRLGKHIDLDEIKYIFYAELNLIKNNHIKKDILIALKEIVPSYFWYIPVSLSGHHFKKIYNRPLGLVHHSKKVGYNCYPLMKYFDYYNISACWAASILHDGTKFEFENAASNSENMDHGELMALKLKEAGLFKYNPEIIQAINDHMYKWGSPKKELNNPLSKIISMADYLASRGVENSII